MQWRIASSSEPSESSPPCRCAIGSSSDVAASAQASASWRSPRISTTSGFAARSEAAIPRTPAASREARSPGVATRPTIGTPSASTTASVSP